MAVNYANALARRIDASFLCCTRMEGLLKPQLAPEVGYLFLNKKATLDVKSFFRLRKFVKENKVDVVQAHGSSWFMGVLLKISLPQLILVWHDHYGKRANSNLKPGLLAFSSRNFDGIITVNPQLKAWAVKNLHCKKVGYIPNFSLLNEKNITSPISLKGTKGLKIVHLANLKHPKDHLTLLKAFHKLVQFHSGVSLHLVGKDEKDAYLEGVRKFIKENGLQEKVFMYGEQDRVEGLLRQADIGVLSSESEGLPVALLEYGQAGLPVVCTRVGECEAIVEGAGLTVPSKDAKALYQALRYYVENEHEREKDSVVFHNRILESYSEEAVMKMLMDFYQKVYTKT